MTQPAVAQSNVENTHVATLREDLVEVWRHQQATAKHQQDVRDQWFRWYLTTSVVIVGSVAALLLIRVWISGLPSKSMATSDVMVDSFSYFAGAAFAFVGALGSIFLIMYMFQVVNYHLCYLVIASIYECLGRIHDETLKQLQLDSPFAYAYGRYQSLSLENPGLGRTKAGRVISIVRDPRLWGADCWANGIHILFISSSLGGLAGTLGASWWMTAALVLMSLLVLGILRQITMATLLALAAKDFEARWRTSDRTEVP